MNAKKTEREREKRPQDALFLAGVKTGAANEAQDLYVYPGIVLTAVTDGMGRNKIYNAQLLSVTAVGESIELECTEGGQTYEVTRAWAQRKLRLAWAIVYAAIQARTCHGTVALHDVYHSRFSRRHLCMGMSRGMAADKVWIADWSV